jgi:NADPH2:quinone reductase
MRHVVCREFGPIDRLQIEEAPDPVPGAGDVLVEVRAAGVTFVDALLVQGRYQITPPLPFTPGGEVAGVITAVGEGVSPSRLQERVLVSCGLGGFAERIAVPDAMARRLPPTLTFGQGAALIQSYATALFALMRRATVRRGDWVLVLGAGGGIGLAMVDVARHLGARVIAAASSAAKLAAARAAGAQECIRYDQEDLKTRVREISGGGVHLVVDPVGGPYAEPALRTLRPFGNYLIVGFAAGEIPALKANLVLLQNRSVVGVDWGAWSFQNPQQNAILIGEVLALAACGTIQPTEPTHYALDHAADALQALIDRKVAGKVVLVP